MATILTDVDGVCADFAGHLLDLVTDGRLGPGDVTQWDLFKQLTEHENRAAKMILAGREFWLTQPVIPGASRFVRLARERGHRVVFVTSPWIGCPEWCDERRKWLIDKMDADPGDIVYASAKELVRGDVMIDDRTENVRKWRQSNPAGMALLLSASYNADATDLRRFTWDGDGGTVSGDYVLSYLEWK